MAIGTVSTARRCASSIVNLIQRQECLMCDYSMHAIASRPAKAGETLISTAFRGSCTRGFASAEETGGRGLSATRHRVGV